MPNVRGAELATAAGVDHLTITVSASEAYSAKNVHMTVAESLAGLDAIRAAAPDAVLDLVVSFAFGSTFDDEEITPDDVLEIADRAAAAGIDRVTLADTTGVATPRRVGAVLDVVGTDVGLHLHDTRATALLNAWTAHRAWRLPLRHGGRRARRLTVRPGRRRQPGDRGPRPPPRRRRRRDGRRPGGAAGDRSAPRRSGRPRHPEPRRRCPGPVNELLWTPPPDAWTATAAGRFATEHGFADYAALHRWSVTDLDGFWRAATAFTGVRWHDAPERMLEGEPMPGVRWFPGATLNYAEHALAAGATRPHDVAVIARSQTREASRADVGASSPRPSPTRPTGLRRLGVGVGDRVVAYAPNIPETLIAFLAAASIGATWSSCAPEFGVRSVIDRFAQIEPVVLVAVDGYRYGAKDVDRSAEVAEIAAALPTLRHVVARAVPATPTGRPPATTWAELVGRRIDGAGVRPRSPPTTRCTCCSARAPPACRSRSSTVTAASSPSTSRCSRCTRTSVPPTASAGSPRPAG